METKTKKTTTAAAAAKQDGKPKGILQKAGQRALEKYGYEAAYVTADGQVFRLECDARNHSRNLRDRSIVKVAP